VWTACYRWWMPKAESCRRTAKPTRTCLFAIRGGGGGTYGEYSWLFSHIPIITVSTVLQRRAAYMDVCRRLAELAVDGCPADVSYAPGMSERTSLVLHV